MAVLAAPLPAAAQTGSSSKDVRDRRDEGFEALFDGKDLDGWRVVPEERSGDWTVRDGVIRAAGTMGASYLVWKDDEIEDFELALSYKMLTEGNTGVEIRARPDKSGKRLFEAYHADLGHVGIGPHILGAWDMHFAKRTEYPIPRGTRVVIGQDGKATTTEIPGAIELEDIKKRDWNRVRVIARGHDMRLWINDKLSSQLVDNLKGEQLDRGFIALQLHEAGTRVEFKDIRLRKLSRQRGKTGSSDTGSSDPAAAADLPPSGYRAALLVGNAKYEGFTLRGVEESLDRLEKPLRKQGFRVIRREDLGEKELRDAADDFATSVPTNGVALVYYIGLGAHVERLGKIHDLLRPVDVSVDNENDYRSRGTNVRDLTESLREESGARVSLIFLDAGWESPIKPETEKVRSGLRELEVPEGASVMFATGSGQTLPVPRSDAPSGLATALSRHLERLDRSVKGACEAIARELGEPWFGGATDRGIGAPPSRPTAPTLREGRVPGESFVNSIGMTFRWCPPGSFIMGSEETDTAATRDREPVEVTLSRGF